MAEHMIDKRGIGQITNLFASRQKLPFPHIGCVNICENDNNLKKKYIPMLWVIKHSY